MILRRFRWVVLFGLGVVAGAVLPAAVGAQVPVRRDTLSGKTDTARTRVDTTGRKPNAPPAGADTIKVPVPARADSMIRNDSLRRGQVPLPPVVPEDTIKPALARAEAPAILEIGIPRVYDRTALFATGALTITDLLSRVPGLTEYSTGFLAAPTLVASLGDFRRIRLYLDGIELDPMDRRARGVAAVNDLPIHALEEVRIERGADEVRVYARSWRVDRTDPYTRADIATGDQNSNLYRAYFGRRYAHGEALQLAAEQYSTQPDRGLPSSDAVNVMARLGLKVRAWNADVFAEHLARNRAPWVGTGNDADVVDTIAGLTKRRTTAYLRLANGDPDVGRWFQFIASANDYHLGLRSLTSTATSASATATQDSLEAIADSAEYISQFVTAGGVSRGPLAVSITQRTRAGGGRTSHGFSARGSYTSGLLSLSAFAEQRTYLNPGRADATIRFAPLGRLVLLGSASRTGAANVDRLFDEPRRAVIFTSEGLFQRASGDLTAEDTAEVTKYQLAARTNSRAEAGVRFRDLWVSGGIIRRGATTLLAPAEFAGVYTSGRVVRTEGEISGKTAAVRGRLYRAINVDAWAVAWNDSGPYRPKYQTRAEFFLQTNLLNRFPSGNFGILTSLAHEYRSSSLFPISTDSVRVAEGYRSLAFKLEIRIQTAVISYQFRNLLQERYAQVPGFNVPRQTQFYGVRWDFWN